MHKEFSDVYNAIEISASDCQKEFFRLDQSVVVLCLDGEATFELNMVKRHIKRHCIATFSPIMTMRFLSSTPDFKSLVLGVSKELSNQISVGIPVHVFEKIMREPVREITNAEDWNMLLGLMKVALSYANKPSTSFSQEIIGGIARCIFLMYGEHVSAVGQSDDQMVYTMGDNYFKRFVELLQTNIKREHEVAFYAEQLHITPKYLGEVCKNKSGHKAKDIISLMLLTNIKRDVILSGKSIKNIAYEYNFADQSSFGKFFKKMTGMSPLVFKKGAHDDFYK